MTFEEYQVAAFKTSNCPIISKSYIYSVIGLAGESGELCNKVKKLFRDGNDGKLSIEKLDGVCAELGDVLWYLSDICSQLGVSLDEIAELNLNKLHNRVLRGVLSGDGDNR